MNKTDYFYTYELEKHEYYKFLKFLRRLEPYRSMSVDAKYIYTLMLDRMGLSIKNGWHDKDGKAYIYFTREEIKHDLNCSSQKATVIIRELIKDELLEEKRQGINKPNKLFLKQIDIKITKQNYHKSLDLTSENHLSNINKITSLVSRKSLGIKTDITKTDITKTDINNKDSVDLKNPPIIPNENKSKTFLKSQNIVNIYNNIVKGVLPSAKEDKISDKRIKCITNLLKSYTEEDFKTVFNNIIKDSFYIGNNDRNWKANLDFILKEDKFIKFLEIVDNTIVQIKKEEYSPEYLAKVEKYFKKNRS